MKFKLHAGSVVDTLTKEELDAGLTRNTASFFQELARGRNPARFDSTADVDGSGGITLPSVGDTKIGPDLGYAWALQRLTAAGLGDDDVLLVYRNSPTGPNFLGQVTATTPYKPGTKGVILRGDERILCVGTSLTATGEISVNGEAIEVAASDLYKIL